MRRLTPALRGRLSRRAIVASPHTWNATAATFAVFGLSDLVLGLTADGIYPWRLFVLTGYCLIVALIVAATRPPAPGSPGAHALVATVSGGVALATFGHAPQGSGTLTTGVFIAVLAALWIPERRQSVTHVVGASCLLLVAALFGDNDPGTLAAVICFAPACLLLHICCVIVLDAFDAQDEALDRLALRDPLTGVGNRRLLDTELPTELTRHAGINRPVSLVVLEISEFPGVNERIGRAAGDAVLIAVARALRAAAPAGSVVTRLEGGHFAVVLADTDAVAARRFVEALHPSLPTQAGAQPLRYAFGSATAPADGADAVSIAAHATATREARPAPRTPAQRNETAWELEFTTGDATPLPPLPRRVSRADLARDRLVWRSIGAAFALYAIVEVVAVRLAGGEAGPAIVVVGGVSTALGILYLLSRPPRLHTWQNHAVVASAYLLPLAAMTATAPQLSWVVCTAMLTPLLIAVRMTDGRQAIAHLAAFVAGCLALIVTQAPDELGRVALMATILNTLVLGLCALVVFDAAEAQWHEIERLVLRDPLTGTANRELIGQLLAEELPRHDALQLPLTLVEFDLEGYDELVYSEGRGAGNYAIKDAAAVAVHACGPHATVGRISGSRFTIVLPFTEAPDTEHLIRTLRLEIPRSVIGRLAPRIGCAEYPSEAADGTALMALASLRRESDDAGSHDLRDDLAVLSAEHPTQVLRGTAALTRRRDD